MSKDIIIGIDLGTTNSEVAIVKNGAIQVLEQNGKATFPSYVGLDDHGALLVGDAARNQYAVRPEQTIRSIKRKMGSDETITLGDQTYTPAALSAIILTALKHQAETALGQSVHRAVITVPAYFNDSQRQATREAGELAGFQVERILNEPTAAAFAYEIDQRDQPAKTILVYDLGGGTFDVSILHMEKDVVEVLSTHGNTHLGGDDIDELVLQRALIAFKEKHPKAELTSAGKLRLRMDCEELKQKLTESASASLIHMGLPLTDGTTQSFEWTVTRCEYEDWTRSLYASTLESVHAALKAASLKAHQLDEIVLVGGSTRTPLVAELLEQELGLRPRGDVHPELAVAYGAGVLAARLMGESGHRILVDITPYTFGIATIQMTDVDIPMNDCFSPIIKAGTPLPCSRGQSFYSAYDGQEVTNVDVYQGEHPIASDNTLVGKFQVNGLDPNAPVNSEAFVTMKLDLDGILTVTAMEKHTGLEKTVVMKNAFGEMSRDDLSEMRSKISSLFKKSSPPDLHVEAREDADADESEPAATMDSIETLLRERWARCRDRLDEEDAQEIESLFQKRAAALQSDEKAVASQAVEAIENILYFAESGA